MNRPMWESRANWYYIRGPNFTRGVIEHRGTIVDAAPILKRFIEQIVKLALYFYIAGSICFLIGSIISLVKLK